MQRKAAEGRNVLFYKLGIALDTHKVYMQQVLNIYYLEVWEVLENIFFCPFFMVVIKKNE